MSESIDFDCALTDEEKQKYIDDCLGLADDIFGDADATQEIRATREYLSKDLRYLKFGRTVIRVDNTVRSVISFQTFEPETTTESSELDEGIAMQAEGVITHFDVDEQDMIVSVSRGFGFLSLSVLGEIDLELIDTFDIDTDSEPVLNTVMPPDSLLLSDKLLLLDARYVFIGD